ncbi:hypothetical protein HY480_03180 [Candidatus Uhrbacteria bacterium]|nr:hypothetical protein [Candidatus Uhrbacteria bacterium]
MRAFTMRGAQVIGTVVAAVIFGVALSASAATTDNVHGWAWNDSAGWIAVDSENCAALNRDQDSDPCARYGRSYGVNISETGVLTGYAWTERAGWMCVGATCAETTGAVPVGGWRARANAITKEVTGWAKILALGDSGWVSFSCANTETCGTIAYRTDVDPMSGQFSGYAWNGASDGRGFGWMSWWPAFGGVTTTWRPVPRCTGTGAACQADVECQLPGELCCLGGAPCGRCEGAGAWCGANGECATGTGTLCCRPGVACGRCVDTGAACGSAASCDGTRDACCPPGAVCTGGAVPTFEDRNGDGQPDGVDTNGDGRADAPDLNGDGIADGGSTSVVGVCTEGPTALCIDRAQCSGGRPCDATVRICAGGEEVTTCRADSECGGSVCAYDLGIRTDVVRSEEYPNGISVPCSGDDPVCKKIIGKCTGSEQLCAVDGNCKATERCGKLSLPWVQALYGGIASAGSVGSARTAPPPSDQYNATYCITAGDRIVNFLSASSSCGLRPQYRYGGGAPQRPGTGGKIARIDVAGLLAGRYGVRASLPGTVTTSDGVTRLSSATPVAFGGGVYIVDGDLEINASGLTIQNDGGSGVIVVRGGNLKIGSNIRYGGAQPADVRSVASIGWVVLPNGKEKAGNVEIAPAVTEVVGAFYVQGTVRTGSWGGITQDKSLIIRGAMVAKQFLFERLAIGGPASEQIIADGRILANTPSGFGDLVKALPTIRQTTP